MTRAPIALQGGIARNKGVIRAFSELLKLEEGQLFVDDPCPSFLNWNNATAIGDSVFVDVAGLGCSVQGPGPILRIWVTGVADGSTLFQGVGAILRDGNNAPVDVLWTPAHIIVACPVRSGESTWSVLKSSFR